MSARFSHPPEPLVDKNIYRRRGRVVEELPSFSTIRPRLPIPVLPDDPGWVRLYWLAWEALWSRLQTPPPQSTFITPFPSPKPGSHLDILTGVFLAQVAAYVPGNQSLLASLDNFYARQHDDGFISRELDGATGEEIHQAYEPNSTGPSLLTWAEWRYYRLTGDLSRLKTTFWPLVAYHRWGRANRTWPSGLYWSTGYSSGLVNQPRVPNGRYHHRHWAWIDASAQACLDAALLERIAILLDESQLAEEMASERTILHHVINDIQWNHDQLFYQDIGPDGRFSPVKSIAAYWVLLDQQLVSPERLTPFIQHLRDSWSFRVRNSLPSLSADSESYNSRTGNGWRGAVWPNLTYMVLRGLHNRHQTELAHKLAANHIEMICRVHEATGLFWDNYAPESLEPGEPHAEDLTGLTPAALINMILENILGLSLDWPLRKVTFYRHLERTRPYGIRNYPLGNEGTLDMLSSQEYIQIRADVPLTLVIYDGRDVVQTAVPAGEFELRLD